jgi:hypothetical protein
LSQDEREQRARKYGRDRNQGVRSIQRKLSIQQSRGIDTDISG